MANHAHHYFESKITYEQFVSVLEKVIENLKIPFIIEKDTEPHDNEGGPTYSVNIYRKVRENPAPCGWGSSKTHIRTR